MDNFFTCQRDNIADLMSNPNFELVRHDVIDPYHIPCDLIYSLACPAAPPHYQFNPVKTLLTSVMGTKHALDNAVEFKAKILLSSTSEVYGDPEIHPQVESYRGCVNPIGIRACYDEGKRAAETLMFDYKRMYNVDIKVVRIFNTYGPGMHPYDGRVVSNFIRQALNNENITIYGDGMFTRSFQFVDDLVEGMIRMMETKDFTGPVNLGNPDEFTIKELADKVLALTHSQSELIYLPPVQDDPTRRKPNIDLAYKTLNGWHPEIKLDQGLVSTINYFKNLELKNFRIPTSGQAANKV
jgi:UDP-glucuronate decarboxylase